MRLGEKSIGMIFEINISIIEKNKEKKVKGFIQLGNRLLKGKKKC